MKEGPVLADGTLSMFAEALDDLERIRCANENRLRTMTRAAGVLDKDGRERGHGLPLHHPDVAKLSAVVEGIKTLEREAILNLQRQVRSHPLWPVFQNERGVGEKQFARLLATIRDPAWHDMHNRPRSYRELKAYCGLHVIETSGAKNAPASNHNCGAGTSHPDNKAAHDSKNVTVVGVAPKRQRGQKSNWNEEARKRLWLIGESIIRQNMGKLADRPNRSQYAETYEKSRNQQYAEALHQTPCIRCGPAGHPAPTGTPLSDGHKKARATRKMLDHILKNLWKEAYQQHQ